MIASMNSDDATVPDAAYQPSDTAYQVTIGASDDGELDALQSKLFDSPAEANAAARVAFEHIGMPAAIWQVTEVSRRILARDAALDAIFAMLHGDTVADALEHLDRAATILRPAAGLLRGRLVPRPVNRPPGGGSGVSRPSAQPIHIEIRGGGISDHAAVSAAARHLGNMRQRRLLDGE